MENNGTVKNDIFLFGSKVEYPNTTRQPAWFVDYPSVSDDWRPEFRTGSFMIVDRHHENDVDLSNTDSALFKVIRTFEDKRGKDVAIVQPIVACSRTMASIIGCQADNDIGLLWLWLTISKFSWIEPIVFGPIMRTETMMATDRARWLIDSIAQRKNIEYLAHALDIFNYDDKELSSPSSAEEYAIREPFDALRRICRMFNSDYYHKMLFGPERVADLLSFLYRLQNGMRAEFMYCVTDPSGKKIEHACLLTHCDVPTKENVQRLIDKCIDILNRYAETDCTAYAYALNNAYYDQYRRSFLSDDCVEAIVAELKEIVHDTLHLMRNLFLDKSSDEIFAILKAPAHKLGDITKDPFWIVKMERYSRPVWSLPIVEPRYDQNEFDRMPGDESFTVYFDQFYIGPVASDNLSNHGYNPYAVTKNAIRASAIAKNAERCQNYDVTVVGASSADTVRVHFSRK